MHNKLRTFAVFISLLFSFGSSFSQNLPLKYYTTLDGLPSQTVYEAFQDKKGFMWFATNVGVSRFDGYRFTNYTTDDGLPDNEIFGFYEDLFGRIWFRSMNGRIAYFQGNQIHNSKNTPSLKSLDKTGPIWKITGTRDSSILISYYTQGITEYTTKNEALEFNFKGDDAAYVGAVGAFQNYDGSYTLVRPRSVLKTNSIKEVNQIIPVHWTVILRNEFINGIYYMGSSNELWKMNQAHQIQLWIRTNSNVINICKGRDKTIWVCTEKGTTLFNSNGQALKENYLKSNQVSSVL